ncbi:uncharacterized protein LOC111632761 [Centruroides sculpturatus]|uniref:uncharacterized protein LOC111632761 n=1 Tax=Centruroides sculpturatus TaxID=218467 RepID=UPI000C6EA303|nr:uncharacterized protein LOC111632761 [Centruroides sculpturatus]
MNSLNDNIQTTVHDSDERLTPDPENKIMVDTIRELEELRALVGRDSVRDIVYAMEMRASAERDRKKLAEDKRKTHSSSSAANEKLSSNEQPSSSTEKVKVMDEDDNIQTTVHDSDERLTPDPENKIMVDTIRELEELRALVGRDSVRDIVYAMEMRASAERDRKKLAEDKRKTHSSSSAANEKLSTNEQPSSSTEKVKVMDEEANGNKETMEENKEMSAIADDDEECFGIFKIFFFLLCLQ